MTDCILPLNPRWLDMVLSGEKTVIPRRIMPCRISSGDKLLFYSEGALRGCADVLSVHSAAADEIPSEAASSSCIEPHELAEYMKGGRRPGYFVLGAVYKYAQPRRWTGRLAPQNFIYI